MANIGDLFFLFRGDDSQLQVDAAKSGDTAGTAAGKRFSVSMGTALKAGIGGAIGGALSAGLSIATKGGVELNAAVTQFAADTGATTEEAAAAQSTIGELFRTNLQSFGEIGGTLAVLRTDLGFTQDAADKAAQSYLDFAQVAGGTGAEAAGRFDDLLGALNLDASKAPGIMDQLVASHQRYGESINANIDALTAMAPALNAANLTVDDGVGLLNMFASAGVDAAAAPAALTKALKSVKSPAELQTLIDQISATEDPFKRAQLASDLFGAKAGPKLAQALAQGKLGDFRVSMDEAAGATTRAADTIQSGFGNQAQLVIKNFGGALAEIGTNFGPLILGFGSLVPALTPVITAGGTAIGGLLAAAIPVGMALLPVLLIGALVAAVAFLIANPEIVGKIGEFVTSILGAIGDFLGSLPEVFASAFGAALDAVSGVIGAIVALIAGLPGQLAAIFVALLEQWVGLGADVAAAVSDLAGQIVDFVLAIPGRIAGLVGALAGAFATAGGRIIGIVTGLVGQVVGFYLSIPGRIAGLVGTIAGFFVSLGGQIVGTVGDFVGSVVDFFLSIPGKVIGIGAEIVGGLIRGMASLPGQLLDTVANAFRALRIDIGPFHISASGVQIDLPRIELPSFASGVRDVPADMLAILHRGEMVVPAAEAAAVRGGAGLDAVAQPAGAPSPGASFSIGDVVIQAQSFAGSQAEARAFARSLFDMIEDEAHRRGLRLAGA